jgi:hypothetical protein
MNLADIASELRAISDELGEANDRWDMLMQMYREQLARVEMELARLEPWGPDHLITPQYRRLLMDKVRLTSKLLEDV